MIDSKQLTAAVERIADSKQDAFGGDTSSVAVGGIDFGAILRWATDEPPDYSSDLREFDRWHYDFLMREPHLRGVLGKSVSLIRNRGYMMTGGRVNVNRSRAILDNANRKRGAPIGAGYRNLMTKGATSFYSASFGSPFELGRDKPPHFTGGMEGFGPLRGIWSADPTLFRARTRNSKEYPIEQYPYSYHPGGKVQYWRHGDMIRIIDNPSIIDEYGDVGLSAVAICRELAEILVAVYQHDKEKLGARAPKGLLLLQNITPEMWEGAMGKRDSKLSAMHREYYGGVGILARAGVEQIDAKLVALSTIPDGFDRHETIDLLMYLYALVFKHPPDEFWPVSTSGFDSGANARLGIERAARSGDQEFLSEFRDQFQAQLPAAVLFEYDEADVRGDMMKAEVDQVHADFVVKLYEAGATGHEEGSLISKQQALTLLANHGQIPPEWTEMEEESVATDTKVARLNRMRERLMDTSKEVRRALTYQGAIVRAGISHMDQFDIVQYAYPANSTEVLWRSQDWPHFGRSVQTTEVLAKQLPAPVKRAVLFEDEDEDLIITDDDVDKAIQVAGERHGDEYAQILGQ